MYLKGYVNGMDLSEHKQVLQRRVHEVVFSSAVQYYEKKAVFTPKIIKKLEEARLWYAAISKRLTKNQLTDIINRFTINFTYESNAIEGNSLTLKDVTFILHENRLMKGKDLREVYETLNTRKAMELLFFGKLRIKEENILFLHETLVKDTGVSLGYKKLPNFLLGRNVQTTPPEHAAEEMKKLLSWYHAQEHLHPLQKAALFHGRFEKIHPFEDGNGRVGRVLLNAILREYNFPPLIIRKTQRIAYFNALQASDAGHPEKLYWFLLDRFFQTYKQFFQIYAKYVENTQNNLQ